MSTTGIRRSARRCARRSTLRLQGPDQGSLFFEIAKECLKLSHAGLRRRNHVDHSGRDESRHLEPLERILESGRTPAEEMLEKFNGPWGGSVEPAYKEYAF